MSFQNEELDMSSNPQLTSQVDHYQKNHKTCQYRYSLNHCFHYTSQYCYICRSFCFEIKFTIAAYLFSIILDN